MAQGKKKAKRMGASYKNYYTAYKVRMPYRQNRINKLSKHCINHPDDKQALKALDRLDKEIPYRRKKPIHRGINSINYPIHSFLKDHKAVNLNLINKLDLYPNKDRQLRPLSVKEQLIEYNI